MALNAFGKSVSASVVSVLYDDTNQAIFQFPTGSSSGWGVYSNAQWVGGTATLAVPTPSGQGSDVTVTFLGGNITFYGNAPLPSGYPSFRVAFNEEPPVDATFLGPPTDSIPTNSTAPPSIYRGWYTFSSPAEGIPSTLKLTGLPPGTSIDYAMVQGNNYTDVTGVLVMVDDTDPQIIYGGSWSETTQATWIIGSKGETGESFQGGVHETSTVGDTMNLKFYGKSMGVYGFNKPTGSMSLSISVDGKPPQTRKYGSSIFSSSSGLDATTLPAAQNFEFFSVKDLAWSPHTLFINVTDVQGNQSLCVDYLAYDSGVNFAGQVTFYANKDETIIKAATPVTLIVVLCTTLGSLLLLALIWRMVKKRGPEGLKRLAKSVHLDLEFSFHGARNFLRSTILDIRAPPPPPTYPPPPYSDPPTTTDDHSAAETRRPSIAQRSGQEIQELLQMVASLTRINTSLLSSMHGTRHSEPGGASGSSNTPNAQSGGLQGDPEMGLGVPAVDSEPPPPPYHPRRWFGSTWSPSQSRS